MHLVVVEGTDHLLDEAIGSGAKITLIRAEEREPTRASRAVHRTVKVTSLDDMTVADAVADVHQVDPVDAVLSLTEVGVVPAAAAAARVGVRGTDAETARVLRDKMLMRRAMSRSSVPAAPVENPDDVIIFTHAVGTPVILKPRCGTASTAVFRIDEVSQVPAVWNEYRATTASDAMVEVYAPGTEYSVESFSHRGHHHVVACVEKLTGERFVELGHVVPAGLAMESLTAVRRAVEFFLDEIGFVSGPAHTEVRVTGDQVVIIESHARVGGDKIAALVRSALGVDLVASTVQEYLSSVSCGDLKPDRARGAAIRFISAPPGVVRAIEAPDDLPPGVVVSLDVILGDEVRRLRSSSDRLGYVLAEGESAHEAKTQTEHVLGQVTVSTEAGEGAGE